MNKKYFLIALTLCFFALRHLANAQMPSMLPQPPSIAQSPNAAMLGLFGDYPVSYYTGIPEITVPLYTLKSRSINVPINLSYHASGVRPDMHPGWVGMNWNLNAGGVISRNIKDYPDEYSLSTLPGGTNVGFYFNHNVLQTSSWNQTSYMRSIDESANQQYLSDNEPDEFSFNFGDYSGRFFLDADGSWKVKCDKPVKVSFDNTFLNVPFQAPANSSVSIYGSIQCFSGFTITTENGTRYVFGGTTDAIDYSIPFFQQLTTFWYASSWYLTKIIAPDTDEVDFTYQRDDFINEMYLSWYFDLGTSVKGSGGIFTLDPGCAAATFSNNVEQFYDGRLISPVYLSKISGANAQINFNRSTSTELRYDPSVYNYQFSNWNEGRHPDSFLPYLDVPGRTPTYPPNTYPADMDRVQWKKLDQVVIEQYDGTVMKSFDLTYNNDPDERLTLLSVDELGQDNAPLPPYTFTYDQSQPLPGYLSSETDHWGFYNNTYADMSNTSTNYITYFNYRQPNATYLYAGTLNKITFPTGGTTEFEFEPNYYSKQVGLDRTLPPVTLSSDVLAGGLRIKKITSSAPDSPSPPIIKEYSYVNNYFGSQNQTPVTSSGILGATIKYYFTDYEANAYNGSGTTNYSKSIFTSQSVIPGCTNIDGNHIGYSTVEEKRSDGSLTIYGYSNFDTPGCADERADNTLQPTISEYEPYSANDEVRGKLISQQDYNTSGVLVRSKNITYAAMNKSTDFVKSLRADELYFCGSSASDLAEEGIAYRLYYYLCLPTQDITTTYDPVGNNGVTTTKSYTYSSNDNLIQTLTKITSKGETDVTKYNYPYDMVSSGRDAAGIYQGMLNQNKVSPVIETTQLKNGVQTNFTRTDYYQPYTNLFYPQSIEVQSSGTSPLENRIGYKSYDAFGNILSVAQQNGPEMSYKWGYNNTFPIVEIKNAAYDFKVAGGTITNTSTVTLTNSSTSTAATSFTLNEPETVNFEMDPTGYPGSPSQAIVTCNYANSLGAPSGSFNLCMSVGGSLTCSSPSSYSLSLPAGTYNFNCGYQTASNLQAGMQITISFTSPVNTGANEFYYEGFEESTISGVTTGIGHTGTKFVSSPFTVSWTSPSNGRTYLISYWYRSSGVWKYQTAQPYTGSSFALTGGDAYDDIRIYPKDAEMTTYTYDPLKGMTSATDAKGITTYYDYDNFLRLMDVKDKDGNIIKHIDYHYQGQ